MPFPPIPSVPSNDQYVASISWTPYNDANVVSQTIQYKKCFEGDLSWLPYGSTNAAASTYTGNILLSPNVCYSFRVVTVCVNGGPTPSIPVENVVYNLCQPTTFTSTCNSIAYTMVYGVNTFTVIKVGLYTTGFLQLSESTTSLNVNGLNPAGTISGIFTTLNTNPDIQPDTDYIVITTFINQSGDNFSCEEAISTGIDPDCGIANFGA